MSPQWFCLIGVFVKRLSLPPMQGIYLLLGTNLGDRARNLAYARKLVGQGRVKVVRESAIYETAAWGLEDQPGFLNQVIEVETALEPEALLELILGIEQEMGRVRIRKWGERLIDIDMLYYHNKVIDLDALKLPHPGIPDRRFTLVPLVELAAEELHPVLHKTQQQLLEDCEDGLEVSVYKG